MSLIFEVIEGEQKGVRFEIQDKAVLGRKDATIVLKDSKVSTRHARIEERDGEFYLIDLGSSNGLKIKGKKTIEIRLQPGLTVQLGRTFLQVLEKSQATTESKPANSATSNWRKEISALLERLEFHLDQDGTPGVIPPGVFTPPIELKFIRGAQSGQNWILGYGPRQIGADSPDFKILEPGAPDICFEIRPGAAGPHFRTDNPEVVHLNGKNKADEKLSAGDIIEILGTQIEVQVWRE